MPRSGGESDKLGNRYESLWTVHNLIDVLAGDAVALQPEAYEEALGVEFVKTLRDGASEFHSVKRQRTGSGWTLRALTSLDDRGRSVLKDLFDKLAAGNQRMVVFVSTTVHSQAYEVWDRSQRCNTLEEFKLQLKTDKRLDEDFTNYVLPLCDNDFAVALKRFHSLRLISQDEYELRRQVETNLRRLLYRSDGQDLDSLEVALKLADFIYGSLGRRLTESDVRSELTKHGYHLRDWVRDTHVPGQVRALNERYLRHVESDHVLGQSIPRPEAATLAKSLLQTNCKIAQLLVGTAGLGKSCVLAQIIREIENAGIPFLAIRLDNIPVVNSTRALGRVLELPDSPAIALAGLSQGRPAVLVVDQLDAMSIVSGRNPDLWQVFEVLLQEVFLHPNIRLLLACRAFDLEHDSRLAGLVKKDGSAERTNLALLPVGTVMDIVRQGCGMPERLSVRELEILSLPFHLYLFLHGEPANPKPFRGRQELFERFWNTKRQMAKRRNVNFEAVVGLLADQLSQTESISVPASRLDLVAEDAIALASDNVLILENGRYRFFHESFFDYAFARRFVRENRDLVHFLTQECTEQHLFRRAQVRQVMAYKREDNRESYLTTLSAFLNHQEVRVHLKKLALDWLAQLHDPTEEEWQIVEPLLKHSELHWAAFNVLWNRLAWFDLLNQIGVLSRLLSDADIGFVNRCIHAFSLPDLLKNRSSEIASLIRPYKGKGTVWEQRFKQIIRFGHIHYSQEMFSLVLELVDEGLFDDQDELRWHSLTDMTEQKPEMAVELLAHVLEHMIKIATENGESDPFSQITRERQVEPHFVTAAAKNAPAQFAEKIVPIIKHLVLINAKPAKSGGYYDDIWHYISFGAVYDTHEALLSATCAALRQFAESNPKRCDELLSGWQKLEHKTLRFLLTCAWLGNPSYFAETAANYFVNYPLAFTVSYEWGVGEIPKTGGALPLLGAISPLIKDETHAKLESAIFGYVTPYEKSETKGHGYFELRLWRHLRPDRISKKGRLRMLRLKGKYPEPKLTRSQMRIATQRRKGGFVPPPIPEIAFEKMKDAQIINALRKYSSSDDRGCQLFSPLKSAAKKARERFAALILKLPNDVSATHFEAILWGLIDDTSEVIKGGPDGKTDVEIPNELPLPVEELLKVVQKVHDLPGKPCGRAICRVADAVAKGPVPREFVQIVAHYAIRDPDPATEVWQERAGGGQKYYAGDPLHAGINSTRGSAADSFSRFLFAHPEMVEELLPFVDALARDKSIAVRAVNVQALMALLNTCREKAVELFLETCRGAEELWATRPVEDFLYYATFTHYKDLRQLLRQMHTSEQKHSRHAAARQITLAAFNHPEADEDMKLILQGDEECRRGVAEIYEKNVFHELVREKCAAHLADLFNDPAKSVRHTASGWFFSRKGPWTHWQQALLIRYIESQAFADGDIQCQMNLKDTPEKLPEEVLRLAERAISLFQTEQKATSADPSRFSYYIPGLILRFYEQSKVETTRRKCLDLFDRMIALGWGEAPTELAKLDRW